MKFLFILTREYLPYFYGGAHVSTHNLAKLLISNGHQVSVLSKHGQKGVKAIIERLAAKANPNFPFASTLYDGYRVYRGWDLIAGLSTVLRRDKPDIVVIQGGQQTKIIKALAEERVPTLLYIRDLSLRWLEAGECLHAPTVTFVANSGFTASIIEENIGQPAYVLPPFVDAEAYRTRGAGSEIVFINPSYKKGADVALQLAERAPDIPFLFVEGWGDDPANIQREIHDRIRRLPNIRFSQNVSDMKSIYAQARIVLAPSGTPYKGQPINWVEAWGRVATEAHFSGIPVIATNDGGLPEAVGPGGILVDRNAAVETWLSALRNLWDNPEKYAAMSEAARKYAQRPEIAPDHMYRKFIEICDSAIKRSSHVKGRKDPS